MTIITRYSSIIMFLTFFYSSCTPKLIDQQEVDLAKESRIVYLSTFKYLQLQESEDLKYILFDEDSFEIKEEGVEDIIEVAVDYANHEKEGITIFSTSVKSSTQRAKLVKELMCQFGIANKSISMAIDDTQPLINDNVIMIKVLNSNFKSKEIAFTN